MKYKPLLLLFSLAALALPDLPFAQTCNAVANGNWSSTATWDCGHVPTVADAVILTGETVTLDQNGDCASFSMTTGTLTGAAFNLNVGGNLQWQGGTISIQNTDVGGTMTWTSGSLSGNGTFTVNGNLSLSGTGSKSIQNKTLVAAGGASWTGGQMQASTSNPAIFRVPAATTFLVNLTSSTNMQNGLTLEILGTLTKQGSTDCSVSGGSTSFSNATLNVEAGKLSFAGGSMGNTTTNLSAGATLECNGGTFNSNSGASLSGAGTFKTSGAPTVNFNSGSALSTALEITGGTVTYVPNLNLPSLTHSSGTFSGSADVTVSGAMNWSGSGTISGTGTLTAAGSTSISGSTKTFNSKTLLITGTASWSGGSLSGSGILRVAGTSVLNLDFTSTISMSPFGKLDVLGTLNKNQSSTVSITNKLDLTGATLNVNAGTLSVGASGNVDDYGTSTFNLASGATYKCTGNSTHNFNSGTSVSGAGELECAGGTVTFSAGSSLSSKLNVSGSTLTDNVGLTPTQYIQSGGTCNGTGSPVVSGSSSWSGGTISGSGSFSAAGGLTLSGTSSKTLSVKTLILSGTSSWSSGNVSVSGNGTFRIAAGANLAVNLSAAQTFSGSAGNTLENLGTLTLGGSATPTFSIASFVQTGTVAGTGTGIFSSTLANQGNVSPGASPGQLTLQTAFNNSAGTVNIEIESDAGDGTGSDLLAISGTATLGGTLNVTLLGGYLPPVGSQFTVMTFTSRTGTFTTENLPVNPAAWQVHYNTTNVTLEVIGSLPLELLDFQGKYLPPSGGNEGGVVFAWRTASEFNTHEFSIERSADGRHFDVIGLLPAAGFSSEERNYSFKDFSPLPQAYYRLRMKDWDGQEAFSNTLFLKGKTAAGWSVFPTLFANSVQVKFEEEGERTLWLFDADGRLVWSGKSSDEALDFSFLQVGAYFLRAAGANTERQFFSKIIKIQ